jgi:glycosyltransferase involved in cell wall biosynthesis
VYAYLPEVEYVFHKAKGLLFNSEGEALLAQELYGPGITLKSLVIGEGVEIAPELNSSKLNNVGQFDLSNSRYVFYLGRRDPTKNVDFLIDAFMNFRQRFPDDNLNLVLAGPGDRSYGHRGDGVIDLGIVNEDEKCALLKNCLSLFQPSRNESYSRVIMEAWFYRKPVVANRRCLATSTFVRQSRGGWLADTIDEWTAMFHQISRSAHDVLADCGQKGFEFAQKHADWEEAIKRYRNLILPDKRVAAGVRKLDKIKTIHQLLADVAQGDAITNYAIALKNYLRQNNYRSELLVPKCNDPNFLNQVKIFKENYLNKYTAIIYHHSIGSDITQYAIQHQGPKSLIYHNITPAKFFDAYRPEFSELLRKGRADLNILSESFSIAAGVSAYNKLELEQAGFHDPQILPIPIDPRKWSIPPDPHLMNLYQDGRINLLFVGRIAPNKCQHHLIEAFEYYIKRDSRARLILVGFADPNDPYVRYIYRIIQEKKLRSRVVVTNLVSDSKLQAFYRTAHLFWSMSEHEGFGIPLIEAMWFNVPVLAFKSSAVPETLGEAGLLFTSKDDFLNLAALAKVLVKDEDIKYKVLAAQRRRRMDFTPNVVLTNLFDIIRKMELQGDR